MRSVLACDQPLIGFIFYLLEKWLKPTTDHNIQLNLNLRLNLFFKFLFMNTECLKLMKTFKIGCYQKIILSPLLETKPKRIHGKTGTLARNFVLKLLCFL